MPVQYFCFEHGFHRHLVQEFFPQLFQLAYTQVSDDMMPKLLLFRCRLEVYKFLDQELIVLIQQLLFLQIQNQTLVLNFYQQVMINNFLVQEHL